MRDLADCASGRRSHVGALQAWAVLSKEARVQTSGPACMSGPGLGDTGPRAEYFVSYGLVPFPIASRYPIV